MHHQSKERKKCQNRNNKNKKKLTRAFPFGLARFRFNEVRINEVPLYCVGTEPSALVYICILVTSKTAGHGGSVVTSQEKGRGSIPSCDMSFFPLQPL